MAGTKSLENKRIPKKVGQVRRSTTYEMRKKPVWLVLLKFFGTLTMFGVGFALLLPLIPLPLWKSLPLVGGGLLIYVGVAFFVRPEPNGDNMGFAGGMFNDPTHYSDNVNRALWNAHCLLGPGRFISETILDCCTLIGLTAEMSEGEAQLEVEAKEHADRDRELQGWRERAAERVAQRQSGRPAGEVELSSARYLDRSRFED